MKRSGFKLRGTGALSLLRSAWKGRGPTAIVVASSVTTADREKLLSIMRLGCPRSTAAKFIGLGEEQLEGLLANDEQLTREVLRAEAEAEVRHMGNVHNASKDEKNWRTSVWWLEQRGLVAAAAPEGSEELPEAVLAALEKFAELIVAEIPDVTRRQSLLTKLMHIAFESVEAPMVIDAQAQITDGAKPQAGGEVDSPAILGGRQARMAGLSSEEGGDESAD
jgi:hypothetical protein